MTTTEAVIRPRRDADLPALGVLLGEIHRTDAYPVLDLADPGRLLVTPASLGAWTAELDGAPVGHVMLTTPGEHDLAAAAWIGRSGVPPETVAVLGRLFVSPAARGHRLGRRLTEVATEYARALGRRPVLDVLAQHTRAIRTYEALGWTRIAETTHVFEDGVHRAGLAFVSP